MKCMIYAHLRAFTPVLLQCKMLYGGRKYMMKDRIKQLRKELHMTQEEFARSISLHRSTISSYECGRVEPPESVLDNICHVFKVNRGWLRDGEGDMFTPERAGIEDNEIFKKNLHDAIDRLTDYQLAVLAEIAKEFGK